MISLISKSKEINISLATLLRSQQCRGLSPPGQDASPELLSRSGLLEYLGSLYGRVRKQIQGVCQRKDRELPHPKLVPYTL